MDTKTGDLYTAEEFLGLKNDPDMKDAIGGFVEVNRDLSELERTTMQIRLYAPCGCGSGKKFKFCCYKP